MVRTLTLTKTIFKLDELDDDAKEKARDWYRTGALDYEWWDAVYEDADRVAKILGIEITHKKPGVPSIWFQGFYTQGSGSSFDGRYSYAKGATKAIKEYAPNDTALHTIAADLQAIQRRHFYQLSAHITSGWRDTTIDVDVLKDGHWDVPEEAEEGIKEAMNDFNHWVFQRLEKEYEYLMSDEAVDENIKANEYEFTSDGEIA
ncbi:antitoxin of toxin-antitoxin stability system [Nitratireductor sp. B36]|uniref:antitoxin of toxin-antitoxin stability system n=1 Tax=Nitratireductor sp. B36 TaxID=2762059 RepID=UPI001E2D072D|nr:antitoxin of toxin-antitoxin stability system [Nitratireductor sp. B36]MCC5780520.1 antitoxin of toxin-antitoxin stability system [Nitratireductor sp. B36]